MLTKDVVMIPAGPNKLVRVGLVNANPAMNNYVGVNILFQGHLLFVALLN